MAPRTRLSSKGSSARRRKPAPAGASDASGGLANLSSLANLHIETPLVANLSGELHALFDPVSEDVLPIYFGPLLGRLYLEGL